MDYIAPLLSVGIIGYLDVSYQTIMGSSSFLVSLSLILLGISLYPLVIKNKKTEEKCIDQNNILYIGLYPIIVYFIFILYMCSDMSTSIQSLLVIFLASGMTVTFAERGIFSSKKNFKQ